MEGKEEEERSCFFYGTDLFIFYTVSCVRVFYFYAYPLFYDLGLDRLLAVIANPSGVEISRFDGKAVAVFALVTDDSRNEGTALAGVATTLK